MLMPPLTRFIDGTGPIFAGKIFPFCFITIACGALSGFHALISSGTTPKMLSKESQARMVGYGSMLMESFVARDGHDRRVRAEAGNLFCGEQPGGRGWASARAGCGHYFRLGISGYGCRICRT